MEELSRSSRKNIRRSLENCDVRLVDSSICYEELYQVYCEAIVRYSHTDNQIDKENFYNMCKNTEMDVWAGYNKENGKMIGYKMCYVGKDYINFSSSKYSTSDLKLRVSDALNHMVLDYYLNKKGYKYVLNGTRSVLHETNVQKYYEEHFGFRKAYCRLHIRYKMPFILLIKCIYPFRDLIPNTFKITRMIKGILKMESIKRSFE